MQWRYVQANEFKSAVTLARKEFPEQVTKLEAEWENIWQVLGIWVCFRGSNFV